MLGHAKLDVAVAVPHRAPAIPTAARVEDQGDVAIHQRSQRLGGDLHVTEERDVGGVREPRAPGLIAARIDLEELTIEPDAAALRLHVHRDGLVTRRHEAANRWALVGLCPTAEVPGVSPIVDRLIEEPERELLEELVDRLAVEALEERELVGQADRRQRAAPALGTVLERLGDDACGRDLAGLRGGLEGAGDEAVVDLDLHAGARAGVVDLAVRRVVAVLAQEQDLDADLSALWEIRARPEPLGCRAALGLDGDRPLALPFDEIELRDEPQALGGEHDRPNLEGPALVLILVARELPLLGVDPTMHQRALDGERVAGELGLRPLEVREALAVEHLVHHASWHLRGRLRRHGSREHFRPRWRGGKNGQWNARRTLGHGTPEG